MPEYENQGGRRLGAPPGSALETRLIRDGWTQVGAASPTTPPASTDAELQRALRQAQTQIADLGNDIRGKATRIEELESSLADALKAAIDLRTENERLTQALDAALDAAGDPPESVADDPDPDTAAPDPPADPPAGDAAVDADLLEMRRADLDGIAAGLGLEPEAYPNKPAIAQAIANARARQEVMPDGA